jgi:hypothetical protein
MAELTVEQRDALSTQNAESWARQAAAAEALLVEQKKLTEHLILMNVAQQAFANLYQNCLEARKTAMSTATTDATLVDVAKDALLMAQAVWPQYRETMGV